ncbi:MAG: hypothetical protein ACLSAC_13055 [Enterocloster bolteae]
MTCPLRLPYLGAFQVAGDQIRWRTALVIGELGLDGRVKPVSGVLCRWQPWPGRRVSKDVSCR